MATSFTFSASAPTLSVQELSREIAALSEEAKERLNADLYGTGGNVVRETEELISSSLTRLRQEMNQIPASGKKQYLIALQRCPEHADDPQFLLKFLRSEQFNVEKAAIRMATYWEKKVEVFGESKSFRRLTLADFDEEDQVALRLGGSRTLPSKDKAGRGIVTAHRMLFDRRTTHRKSMLRVIWYIHHVAIEDIDVQRNGLVLVAEFPGTRTSLAEYDRKLDSIIIKHVRFALPVRVMGVHHYLSNRLLEIFIPVLLVLFGPEMRARYRYHKGTDEEFWDELARYGIARSCLPRDVGGTLEFSYEEWLQNRLDRGL